MFFTFLIVFLNVNLSYIFYSITIESNCFSSFLTSWSLILSIRIDLWTVLFVLSGCFPTVTAYVKHIIPLFFEFIAAFLFFNYWNFFLQKNNNVIFGRKVHWHNHTRNCYPSSNVPDGLDTYAKPNWKAFQLIEKLFNNFTSIKTSHDFFVVTLRMHQKFVIVIFWWHEVDFLRQSF